MHWLFRKSKWLHKFAGLVLIIFLMWMSISGILMNHPDMIAGYSVPQWLLPSDYHIKNWNRSAMTRLVYSPSDSMLAFGCGKSGIWKSEDGGRTFSAFMEGLPKSRLYRKSYDLFILDGKQQQLFAATNGGLYICNLPDSRWQQLIPGNHDESFLRIQQVKNQLLIFSNSHIYKADLNAPDLKFTQLEVQRNEPQRQVSLVRLFFDVHYGKAWGLPGLLFFDLIGLIIFFLSISAFYAWYFPKKRRREQQKKKPGKRRERLFYKYLFKYHLKIGVAAAFFMAIVAGTGLFMRPPLLAALADGWIPASAYPGFLEENPWDRKIHNAMYDAIEDRILIEAEDGLWSGPSDFSRAFEKTTLKVPIFVMGATVLQTYAQHDLLIGSFSGLFHWQRQSGEAYSLRNGVKVTDTKTLRPSKFMVTGYLRTYDGREFMNTHEQGIIPINDSKRGDFFQQPAELMSGYRMPLWNYLFEIHNARIFETWIGAFHILVIPLGSMLFLLVIFSGVFDWFYLKWGNKSGRVHSLIEKRQNGALPKMKKETESIV